jgi:chlorobactene glucosyltransferase
MLTILVFISSLVCLTGLAILTWLHTRHRLDVVVRPVPPPAEAALVSVIVPARNEDRNIRRCVESLLAQTYPNFELIVLDDRSTDATPLILNELAAREPRLRLLTGSELPEGWAGKPHALAQAAAAAGGKWLCFVDADTFAAPQALASVYAAAREHFADLFTILTFQELDSFWEKVVLPLVMTALSVGFSPRRVNRPDTRDAIANGQFILIKRSVYEAVGGHAAIKDSIVEDKDLANLVKHSGYRLIIADGKQVARTRMYTSLAEMWEGWTKNIFLGLRGSPGLLLLGALGAFLSLFAALLLPVWLAAGLVWWGAGGGLGALAVVAEGGLVWAYLVFWRLLVCRGMHISSWYALTVPLGAAVFAGMMLVSAWKVLSGRGVTWKGRRYSSHP